MRLVRSCNPSSSPHCPSPWQASLDAGLSREGSHLDVKYISRADRRRTCADASPAHRRDGERMLPHRSEGGRSDPGSPYWRDDDRNGDCRSRYARDLSCKVNHPSKRDLFSSRCSSSERSDHSLTRVSSLRCYAPRSHADAQEGNDERYSIERYHSDGHGGKRAKRDQISSSINGSSRHTSVDLSPIHDSKKLNHPLRLKRDHQERQTESRHGSTTTWNRIEYGPLNDHAAGRQQTFEHQQSLNRQFLCAVKETSDTDVGQQQEKHKQLCGLGYPSVPHKDKELSKNEICSSPEDAVKVTDEFVVSEMKEIIQPKVNVLRVSRDAAADAIIIGAGHVVAKEETVLHTLDTLHEVESKPNQMEHQLASEDPYLMLASLLLEDSLDVQFPVASPIKG